MTKEYDVKDVNIYITDVMKLQPLKRVELWLALQQGEDGGMVDDLNVGLFSRFFRQGLAVQANILYRFGPIIEKTVREQAQAKAREAREAGVM
jgi:hypothetical protein